MRILSSLSRVLGNFFVLCLLTSIVTSAISLDSIIRDLPRNIFRRSLPGSLAVAPAGAVGYLPGPVVNDASPTTTTTHNLPDATATNSGWTAHNEMGYGLEQALPATDSASGLDEPRENLATVTGTEVLKAATQNGSANTDMALSSASLLLSISILLLQL